MKIKLEPELGKFTIERSEVCHLAKFSFETRLDDCPSELTALGINLDAFLEPGEAEASKIVYGNIPLLTEAFRVSFCGDENDIIRPHKNIRVSKAEITVKDVDKQTVAVFKITLSDLPCDIELYEWLYRNTGKIVTVELERVQGELFKKEKEAA